MKKRSDTSRILMSVSEAARALGVSRQRVHMLIASRRIAATKVGGRYVITRKELERFARERERRRRSESSSRALRGVARSEGQHDA
jgi:excisionase family DNA binding protein